MLRVRRNAICSISWTYKSLLKYGAFWLPSLRLMDDRTIAGKKSPVRPPVAGRTSLRQPQQIIGRHLIELGELDQMGNLGAFVVLPCVDCPAGHTHSSGKVGLGIAVRQAQMLQTF